MRIRISHDITHRYSPPARMLIQNLRLTPFSFDSQYALGWRIEVDIDAGLRQGEDAHGNVVSSFSHHGAPVERLVVSARGEVETTDAAGVIRGAIERLPAEMYLRDSPLARTNGALKEFALDAKRRAADPLDALHRLMSAVHGAMAFDPRGIDGPESAIEAFALRRGGARDFAHVFIASARFLGLPARFVGGYRSASGAQREAAGEHAWAEAHAPKLGWVAFDPTASICTDAAYVRVVIGFDAQDGAFVREAHGSGDDEVETAVRVEQAGFQTQA